MRTLKLITVGLVLALTSMAYAAGAMQDAEKPQGAAKAEKRCCQMKPEGAQAYAHRGMKHGGEACCGSESCCAGDACDTKHKGGHATPAVQKTATGAQTSGCCSGDSCCCDGGSCMVKHKEASATANAHATASCCTDGAACCHGDGQACCKAHQSDTTKAAAAKSGDKSATSCCGATCSCCGKHAGQAMQTAGQ
jgi:hypothetical protein